jgi:uncharacterized protein YkwD
MMSPFSSSLRKYLCIIVFSALPFPLAAWSPGTGSPDAVSGFTVNASDRRDVLSFYQCVYNASENYATNLAWTEGSVGSCAAGTTSAAFKDDVRRRINFYRALVGETATITFDATKSSKAQQAALMMASNSALSHTPPTSWSCYTQNGYDAANAGNIALGHYGPPAVNAYMRDDGTGNEIVGHRRWFLYSRAQEMGTGDIPVTSGKSSANCVWVIGNFKAAPAARFTLWPNEGFAPVSLVPTRWSLSYPSAGFASATVTATQAGNPVSTAIISTSQTGVGDNTISWTMAGLPSTVTNDVPYVITVAGITGGGPTSKTYTVTLFDPNLLGESVTISGSNSPLTTGQNYDFNAIAQADSYELVVSKGSTAAWTEGAEDSPTPQITESVTAGLTVRQTAVRRTGSKAFQLAFPSGFADQSFTVTRNALISATSSLNYYDRGRFSSTVNTFRTQISTDNGSTWTTLATRNGVGLINSNWDSNWISRSISLAAYASQVVQIRFILQSNGSATYGTSSNISSYGFFVDDITITNSTELITPTTTTLASNASTFTLNATTAGGALVNGTQCFMRIRPNVGCRWFGYGALKTVTAATSVNYATWATGFPGVASAPGFLQDADFDGISNGIEHVLGSSPSAASTGIYQVSGTATSVKFRHTKTNSLATNVTIAYQWSTDLLTWHASGATNAGGTTATIATATITDTSAPSLDVIEVTTTVTAGANKKVYARMTATTP